MSLIALIQKLLAVTRASKARLGHAAIPRRLLESAGARAAGNPRAAAELRRAAVAYLSVVR